MTQKEFAEFNSEIARLREITWQGYAKTLKEVGISYLGSVNHSAKLSHNATINMHTYGVYLASGDLSGYEVCSKSVTCRETCLYGSGQNKLKHLSNSDRVDRARILKTRLFFANKKIFMLILIYEIELAYARAKHKGYEFSVRLNCTSDINIRAFQYESKCIVDMFPEIMFYDYTKVPTHLTNVSRYKNYHLTFSYDGTPENYEVCKQWLEKGYNIAVVFGVLKGSELPTSFMNYKVLDGQLWDFRPWDLVMYPDCQIVGLTYKTNANDYYEGKFIGIPQIPFIVQTDNPFCKW